MFRPTKFQKIIFKQFRKGKLEICLQQICANNNDNNGWNDDEHIFVFGRKYFWPQAKMFSKFHNIFIVVAFNKWAYY